MEQLIERLSQLLWGRGTVLLTLLCGLYFTVGTGFLPLTRLPAILKGTVGSLLTENVLLSALLGVFAFSSFWTIKEVFEQQERVLKGWFPMNPRRAAHYESLRNKPSNR